jgi:hypothetical protein
MIIETVWLKVKSYLQQYFSSTDRLSNYFFIGAKADDKKIIEIRERMGFYFNNASVKIVEKNRLSLLYVLFNYFFDRSNKFLVGYKIEMPLSLILHHFNFYDVDFDYTPDDGWKWHLALTKSLSEQVEIQKSKKSFLTWFRALKKLEKTYIFGTGPSLAEAINFDYSDGCRIACNTIVKDSILWHHINPDVIVAGDAIYHFGKNEFAQNFIIDLKMRLTESPHCVFVYPYLFHGFVKRELSNYENQLLPIPFAPDNNITRDLKLDFRLPGKTGNVLNILLLPLGTFLSKHVILRGFDGRNPNDALFWKNSGKHTYDEKLHSIVKDHPKFFEHHLPANKPLSYVEKVHGKRLDRLLTAAEKKGWKFEMAHKSWTNTLNKRFEN